MTWDDIQNSLSTKLKELNDSDYIDIEKIDFEKGLYIFYENNIPIYVGRSNRIKKRLKEHSKKNSNHFSASFAFLISKHQAKIDNLEFKNIDGSKMTRSQLEINDAFKSIFSKQKERVSEMKYKVLKIEDSNFQAVLEIYLSMQLNTLHNKFDNH
jgi:predicted GIY-YIG superfamily endonuclease